MKHKWVNILPIATIAMLSLSCESNNKSHPIWLENNAELAIQQRTASDFSLTIPTWYKGSALFKDEDKL